MENPIDNFRATEHNLLRFDEEGEFYMILVLKRRKDTKGKSGDGVPEENRLIKHFFVYDKEYFRKKNPKPSSNTKLNHSKVLLKTHVRNALNFYTTLIARVIYHLILYLS